MSETAPSISSQAETTPIVAPTDNFDVPTSEQPGANADLSAEAADIQPTDNSSESEQSKEFPSKKTVRYELGLISGNIIDRHASGEATPETSAFRAAKWLNEQASISQVGGRAISPENPISYVDPTKNPQGISTSEGTAIKAPAVIGAGGSQQVDVLFVTGFDGTNFTAKVQLDTGAIVDGKIAHADMVRGQILNTEDQLTTASNLSSAEQLVVRKFIDTLKTDEDTLPEPGTDEGDELNKAIQQAATEGAIPTASDLQSFLDNASGLTPQDSNELMTMMQGTNILSPAAIEGVLRRSNISPENLTRQIDRLQEKIDALQTIPEDRMTSQQKRLLKDAQEQMHMLSESKRLFAGPLKDILVTMHEGQLDQTLARALTEGIRNGSFDGDILKNAEGFRPLPGESTEEWRRRMTKKLGFAALIAVILMGTVIQTMPAALPQQSGGH